MIIKKTRETQYLITLIKKLVKLLNNHLKYLFLVQVLIILISSKKIVKKSNLELRIFFCSLLKYMKYFWLPLGLPTRVIKSLWYHMKILFQKKWELLTIFSWRKLHFQWKKINAFLLLFSILKNGGKFLKIQYYSIISEESEDSGY